MILFFALSLSAFAGKLADGFRNIPWGEYPDGFKAPLENCVADPEPSVPWSCPSLVGNIPVKVSFLVQYNIYHSVFVEARGTSNCLKFNETARQAYGAPEYMSQYLTGAMDDQYWSEGPVIGTWKFNKITEKCTLIIMHRTHGAKADGFRKNEAVKATKDL